MLANLFKLMSPELYVLLFTVKNMQKYNAINCAHLFLNSVF